MQVLCPKCGQTIAGGDLNVATDVARCAQCDEVFELSSLVRTNSKESVDLDNPPRGAWYQPEFNGFVVGATTRHPIAFFIVPFMCVWSGITVGGIYGSQIVQGQFDLRNSLFGIPFLLGSLYLGTIALMTVCGKVVVNINYDQGVVFTGIGSLGWRRRFQPLQIKNLYTEEHRSQVPNAKLIVLDGPQKLRFGSGLTANRRDFMIDVLVQELDKHRRHQASLNASRSSA